MEPENSQSLEVQTNPAILKYAFIFTLVILNIALRYFITPAEDTTDTIVIGVLGTVGLMAYGVGIFASVRARQNIAVAVLAGACFNVVALLAFMPSIMHEPAVKWFLPISVFVAISILIFVPTKENKSP